MQYKIFFSSLLKCQEVFQNEILMLRIHSLYSFMILSWYFFKDIENLRFCKMTSWWLCFIIINIMKTMRKSFKFFMRAWVKAWWLFFVVSMICRISIFDWIIVSFCFFCSSSYWSIAHVTCSLISKESLSFAFSLSDFIMWCSFSDMMFCKIKISSFQFCCNYVAIVMLEYWIIISKKSLK